MGAGANWLMASPIKTNWPLAVLRNEDGSLDEVVCDNAYVHLEKMAATSWWIRITRDGRSVDVWLSARGKITATVEETSDADA